MSSFHNGTVVHMLHHAYIPQISNVSHSTSAPLDAIFHLHPSLRRHRFHPGQQLPRLCHCNSCHWIHTVRLRILLVASIHFDLQLQVFFGSNA
jgi:hypothetical protein